MTNAEYVEELKLAIQWMLDLTWWGMLRDEADCPDIIADENEDDEPRVRSRQELVALRRRNEEEGEGWR